MEIVVPKNVRDYLSSLNQRIHMKRIIREFLTGILFTAGIVFLACEGEDVKAQLIAAGLSVLCFLAAFLTWKVVKE